MKTDDLILLPRPARLTRSGGTTALPSRTTLPDALPEPVRQQAEALCTNPDGPELLVRMDDSLDSPEAYRLVCAPDAIILEGGSGAGVWYGLQTLGQLARRDEGLPCVEIIDTPDFRERGFMLDISRNKVPTMQSLFELVDLLGSLKINQLQLYTEHTFAFPGHELVWGDASPVTGEEIRELDAYCRDRYIELVPNLNSFGHMERWLRWPEYAHLAESPYGWNFGDHLAKESGTVLKPNEDSLAFVDSLYWQMLPHFSSSKFNIGCDETWELGLGWSRPEVEKVGKHEVYLRFLLKLAERVKAHGRQPQFWADILLHEPDSIRRLPKEMVPVIWGYEAEHPFDEQCPLVAKSGLHYTVAPGTSTWKTLTGNLTNAFPNLLNAARNGRAHGAHGYLITNWGDLGHHQTWPLTLPGLAYGAALAWSVEANVDMDLKATLDRHVLTNTPDGTASVLTRLGHLGGDSVPDVASALFTLFFSENTHLSHNLRNLDRATLDGLIDELDSLKSDIPEESATLMQNEIRLSIDMASWACRRGQAWLDLVELRDASSYDALRGSLQELIGRFEATWIARNRPGGLHDSSARMRKILLEIGPRPRSIDYNPS